MGLEDAIILGKFEVPLYVNKKEGCILFVAVNSYINGETAPSHFNVKYRDGKPTKSLRLDQFKLAVAIMCPELRGDLHLD